MGTDPSETVGIMMHDSGHALIAAIYFRRWQKPIPSGLIRQYHPELDQALMGAL